LSKAACAEETVITTVKPLGSKVALVNALNRAWFDKPECDRLTDCARIDECDIEIRTSGDNLRPPLESLRRSKALKRQKTRPRLPIDNKTVPSR
jgi:hypothetical protein